MRGLPRRIAGLGFLPPPLRAPVMNRILTPMQKRDVLQDVTVWSRKKHRTRPRLARSDGEIMQFRADCRQFYPDSRSVDGNHADGNEVSWQLESQRQ